MERGFKFSGKLITFVVLFVFLVVLTPWMFGINYAGERTVVQYPSGTVYVKFSPGFYTQWFGTVWEYKDLVTFDFDKQKATEGASIDQSGIAVRYQDGGTGTVFGKARFFLPTDEPTMIKLHKAFREHKGLANKLVRPLTEESLNLTAGLMTSEEAYAEKRAIYTQWAEEQVARGKYKTKLKEVFEEDKVTGKRVLKSVPVIDYDEKTGRPKQFKSDLIEYGIRVTGFQITDWSFEKSTLDQISRKREATMAIITAKADAERAKQDSITAEEQGKANVTKAKYEKEVEKEKAVVVARQKKEVAVINAEQLVDVAKQIRLESEQKKLAAVEYKQEQIFRGEGDAERKRLAMEADGALQQKLDAYKVVMGRFAEEFAKQKWVPEVQMGSSGQVGTGNAAANLIDLLTAKTLKDLGLDMSVPAGKAPKK